MVLGALLSRLDPPGRSWEKLPSRFCPICAFPSTPQLQPGSISVFECFQGPALHLLRQVWGQSRRLHALLRACPVTVVACSGCGCRAGGKQAVA